MRKVKIIPVNKVGYFHIWDSHDNAIIELEDGTLGAYDHYDIQFIDQPEDEQIQNIANAILQGLAQRNGWYWQGGGSRENLDGFLSSDFAKMYDEIISEFKKSKP